MRLNCKVTGAQLDDDGIKLEIELHDGERAASFSSLCTPEEAKRFRVGDCFDVRLVRVRK